jgi:cAMP-binding proteins - catabolite gene activator and regulatory subunit of cAMP-dependent protein kinases
MNGPDQIHAPIPCSDCGIYQLCLPTSIGQADVDLLDKIVKNRRIFKRGDYLYRLNHPFQSVYAIRSGSVKTYVLMDDGRLQITGFHIAGELLGLSAVNTRVYSCEARALETTSVCEIPFDRLEELGQQVPSLQYQMLRIMSREIAHNQELMLLLGRKNAEERLATYLISLSSRFAKRSYSATEFNLSMSRGDIGNYLGMAEETVCRVLARFEQEGLIAMQRRLVRLKDVDRLSAVARGNGKSESPAELVG